MDDLGVALFQETSIWKNLIEPTKPNARHELGVKTASRTLESDSVF